jgi:hypothetical protein
MSFMLLVVESRGQRAQRTPEQGKAVYQQMVDFAAGLKSRGVLKAVESLARDDSATRIAVRGGKSTLTDGPFSEAKEMIGGFFLLDCATKQEALAIAAKCPAAEWATIEVRETAPCFE